MATASGCQASPMVQQADHTTTPPLAQADTTQSSATTTPSQIVFSDAAQQTDSGATAPVSPNSVTSSLETRQGLMKWCLEHWLVIFIGVVLVTIYFVIGYLKSPDREWASIENEYQFCEAHPVRSNTRSQKTELTSLLLFHNTTECKENESLVWKKYGPAPSHIKRTVPASPAKQNSNWALLGYSILIFFFWMGSPGPNPGSTPQPLDPRTVRLTRIKIYKVVCIPILWFPYSAWTVWLFLRGDWSFSFVSILKYSFYVNIIFNLVFFLYDHKKELEDWIKTLW